MNIFEPKALPPELVLLAPVHRAGKHRWAKHPDTDDLARATRRAAGKRAATSRRINRGTR